MSSGRSWKIEVMAHPWQLVGDCSKHVQLPRETHGRPLNFTNYVHICRLFPDPCRICRRFRKFREKWRPRDLHRRMEAAWRSCRETLRRDPSARPSTSQRRQYPDWEQWWCHPRPNSTRRCSQLRTGSWQLHVEIRLKTKKNTHATHLSAVIRFVTGNEGFRYNAAVVTKLIVTVIISSWKKSFLSLFNISFVHHFSCSYSCS